MKIHAAQRKAFAERAAETFPRRVRALLVEKMPERASEFEGEAGLARVGAAVEEAQSRGFRGERDACKYVVLHFLYGEGFAEEEWAAAVLADPRIPTPTERADALWDAAERRELDEGVADLVREMR